MLFVIGWIIYSYLSLLKPIISGVIKIIYPIFILVSFGIIIRFIGIASDQSLLSNFGVIYPSFGLFLMIFSSISTIIIGIWKKKYEKKVGLKKKKRYELKKDLKNIIQRGKMWERN